MKHRITYRVDTSPAHDSLTIWVNGGCAGTVTVRNAGHSSGDDERDVLNVVKRALRENGATGVDGEAARDE